MLSEDSFTKLALILISTFVSLMAQINLKVTSPQLPSAANGVLSISFIILIARVGIVSGASLGLSWYSYRKFGFLELILAQSLIYVFAIGANVWFFNEPLKLNQIGSVLLILSGIGLFYVK